MSAAIVDLPGLPVPTDESPSSDPGEEPAEAKPSGVPTGRQVVVAALLTVTALALWCVLFVLVLSPLQEHRAQQELRATLRGTLAGQTSPLGGHIAAGTPIGSLDVPAIGVHNLVFIEGTTSTDLESGPGHRPDTPLPGQPGVAVLQGRSHLYGAPFGRIGSLRRGSAIEVTTGQGRFVYRVTGQRRAGDPEPTPPQVGQGRLTLVTAESSTTRGHAGELQALYVDAKLQGQAQPAPGGRPVSIGVAQTALHGESGALAGLVFWLVVLVLGGLLLGWSAARWQRLPALLLGAPALVAVLWAATEAATRLLPNLL